MECTGRWEAILLGRMFEQIMANQGQDFLDETDILDALQSDLRPDFRTQIVLVIYEVICAGEK